MTTKKTIYLKDYTPPAYLVDTVDLRVELDPVATLVTATLSCRANPAAPATPLMFNGEGFKLESLALDGKQLAEDQFAFVDGELRIAKVPAQFTLQVRTLVNPSANTALEGLYLSSGNFCTQCEAEGFRKITCFPDRPDIMSVFTTTVIGDLHEYPILLANGNLQASGEMGDGRHWATWHDPFPKPCYLFALVAGNLVSIEDRFTTMSGREVDLRIYVEPRNKDKCGHAMQALKKAMRWDEERFGREYDLDTYMIVAVDDFNMGAMENKGLNVFNSKYVLALPETATDADYDGIEGVIAHEYFHNWTGNRITCRDWFQLSLKEGLTVFRDQEFSSDMGSRPVKRINDANIIRSLQFREDSGPMAHPVRPASFVEINNFYTVTVYNKGAEVIRMLHTLLGAGGFRRGMDLYFTRHDGQAVTCDDFVQAMADANQVDLSQFKLWYSQAGTPVLTVREQYDAAEQAFSLQVSQTCPPTPGQEQKQPFAMPLVIGLLDEQGKEIGQGASGRAPAVSIFNREEQVFRFTGVPTRPRLSFLRDFCAPVRVIAEQSEADLAFLLAHDADPFNRWDAGQRLALKFLLRHIEAGSTEVEPEPILADALGSVLNDQKGEHAFLAQALTLPSENWIMLQLDRVDPLVVFSVRQAYRHGLGNLLRDDLLARYHQLDGDGAGYRYTASEAGRRSLRNCCLAYLTAPPAGDESSPALLALAEQQYRESDNMTDRFAALTAVVNGAHDLGSRLLAEFYDQWRDDPLVVDKWLALQAGCPLPGALDRVRTLMAHPAFNLRNPNKVRALIGTFCSLNHAGFHDAGGAGYRFLADNVILLDRSNPQVAARMLAPLTLWRRYTPERGEAMRNQLERIGAEPDLSSDVAEVVSRSLAV